MFARCNGKHLYVESQQKAIEALEKQIPKKPIKIKYKDAEGYSRRCPNQCMKHGGYVCVAEWQEYCNNCGQKIDWSDAE